MHKGVGLLGRMVMVAVAAILIGSCLAAPAAATSRDDGTKGANDFIAWCVGMGGEPEVLEAGDEYIEVACDLPDGSQFNCGWFDGNDWGQRCFLQSRPLPGGDLPTLEPGTLHPVEPVASEPAPVSPPVAAPTAAEDDKPVANPKPKKKKEAKKAKKAKGKGKPRGRGR